MSDSLKLIDVSKRYDTAQPVLSGVSYEFQPGTATGLIGPNGSGKTTLLRLLSATSYPTSGKITYRGLDIHQKPYDYLKEVGIVNDAGELPQYLSAVQLLEWILRAKALWSERSQTQISDLLNRLYLDDRRHNLIGTYSSGMLRKTQIAAASISNPSVLLMDEPFRGLDAETREATLALLREFREDGGILVVASHLKSSLSMLCDDYLQLPLGSARQ